MKLLLVDGHALAYRSYFAMLRNPLTNERGENTSAEFGFIRGLKATMREHAPEALLVCFDPIGKTFRHEKYPAYKAQRAKMPDDLRESLERIFEFLDAMGYSWLRRDGYEADDVLASAARKAERVGWEVLLMSGDKDLCQVVSDKISVLRPASGKKENRILGPAGVKEEFGVAPEGMLDYLSLIGDSSDNVPGVPGMGPKTTLKLLEKHEGLEEIYAHLDELGAATRRKLEEGRESAFFSRELIKLVEDLDLEAGPEAWPPGPGVPEDIRDWFIDRGFHSLLREFDSPAAERETLAYETITDEKGLRKLIEALAASKRFAVDTETDSLDSRSAGLVGISLALAPGEAYYLPVEPDKAPAGFELPLGGEAAGLPLALLHELLGPLFADTSREKVAQNLKFDMEVLERAGLPLEGPFFDSMLASYCVDPIRRSHGLDSQVLDRLGHEMLPYSSLFEKGDREKDIRKVPLDRLAHYAAEDADFTLRLADLLTVELREKELLGLFEGMEMPLIHVLRRMENAGIAVDCEGLAELSVRMEEKRRDLAGRIHAGAGREFMISSPKQLSQVLFEELGLPTGKKTKTGYSTDEEVLGDLAAEHDIATQVLEWRELSKLKSTYVDVLPAMVSPETGRVHTSFNQAVASTGRLSSSDPNLQNIPIRSPLGREIRRAFIAPPGRLLVSFDYSQVELRILAHLSEDEGLRDAFASGLDIHRWTAARIAGKQEEEVDGDERSVSKMVNYGVLYGMGATGLSRRLRIPRTRAQEVIDEYFAAFPGIRSWIDETLAEARVNSSCATLFGRRRELPNIHSGNGRIRSSAERVAINMPIQGSAADVIKLAMLRIDEQLRERKLNSRMLLQVHDELLFESDESELAALSEMVVPIMEGVADFKVPLLVDWGSGANWLEAH